MEYLFIKKKKQKKKTGRCTSAHWRKAWNRRSGSIAGQSREPSNSVEGHRRLTLREIVHNHKDGPGPSRRSSQKEEQVAARRHATPSQEPL